MIWSTISWLTAAVVRPRDHPQSSRQPHTAGCQVLWMSTSTVVQTWREEQSTCSLPGHRPRPEIAAYHRYLNNSNNWCAGGCVVECQICNREVAGSNLNLGYFAPRSTQPSIPLGLVNEYQQWHSIQRDGKLLIFLLTSGLEHGPWRHAAANKWHRNKEQPDVKVL